MISMAYCYYLLNFHICACLAHSRKYLVCHYLADERKELDILEHGLPVN